MDEPNSAFRVHEPILNVSAWTFSQHLINGFRDPFAVVRMHASEKLRDRRNSLRRIKPGNFIQFPRPIIADSGRSKRPAPRMRKALPFGEEELASLQPQSHLFSLSDVGERANETGDDS